MCEFSELCPSKKQSNLIWCLKENIKGLAAFCWLPWKKKIKKTKK